MPSPAASERLGSSISEPSLSTRDALDKYQIVAQKVAMACAFLFDLCLLYLLLIDLFSYLSSFSLSPLCYAL